MSNPPQYGPTALPQGANDGGDGSSLDKATWVAGSDKNARSFIILQGKDYVRCNMGDALQFYDSGYRVFDPPTGRRVKFQYTQPGRPKFGAFEHQYWEIQMEEHASLVRGDRLPGEDLGEDAEEEYETAGDAVFDRVEQPPSTPSRSTRGSPAMSPPSGGRGRGSPSTPRGPSSGGQPGSGRGSAGRGSNTPRGRGSAGSRRGQGSPQSPTSPSFGKGKGPAGSPSGGSPGSGAA
ncbi:uncharacterized protein J4E88_001738 [Alternaria novae-zelandiae]|uniref:uncharacterized protein n=1 Tax=Alternaria novae-zelandiae TaxID=430562 RepID=UPI0020C53E1C|nr:uncharacterized protein J4E88_001738 [Alternaria novae-zelandiae]KAI4693367.1 hypothetical protein J4E88_001738 [Alternaria novae-zelandiae]